jgi:glycosyltransferase involved in cell wall biosynthesis
VLRGLIDRAKDAASAWLDEVRPLRSPRLSAPLPLVVPPRAHRPAGRPVRVLLQVEHFDRGGMEGVVLELARRLPQAAFEVQILTLGRRGAAADVAAQWGVPVATLSEGSGRDAAYRRLIEGRFDVVNAHASVYGAEAAAAAGAAFVQTVHGCYVWADDAQAEQMRAADRHTTAYLCVSSAVADYTTARFGVPREKLRVCRNGVDVEAWRSAPAGAREALRRQFGFAADDVVVLVSGAITTIKGQLPLVRALRRAVEAAPRLRLLLAGGLDDGRYVRRVRAAAHEARLAEKVVFAGHVADARGVYHAADAFAQPSFAEGWSLALAEAAAAGLPLVATDVGAATEIVPAAGGRLVRLPFDPLQYENRSLATLARRPHADFEAQLADALVWAANAGRRTGPGEDLRSGIDIGPAIEGYGRALAEIAGG